MTITAFATRCRDDMVPSMPPRSSLNVSLTPELTSYVAALVGSGRYRSASEVLRASLRLLQQAEPPHLAEPLVQKPRQDFVRGRSNRLSGTDRG